MRYFALLTPKTIQDCEKSCNFARVIIKTTAMKTKNEILHLLTLYKPTAESKYGLDDA